MEKQNTRRQRTIYDNYDLCKDYDEVKTYLQETYYEDGQEIPDKDVWDEIYENDRITWEYEAERLQSFFADRVFVLRGTSGRWNGSQDAGSIIRCFSDLYGAWKDCDWFRLYDVDGHFFVESAHHDGTNHYELRELNRKGMDFLELHGWDMDDRELHEKLWEPRYSRLPNYAHLVFGCPRREAA